jgi:diguanylate cyclase (GGDEF)-like protein/PAS domain S-box-containing protein
MLGTGKWGIVLGNALMHRFTIGKRWGLFLILLVLIAQCRVASGAKAVTLRVGIFNNPPLVNTDRIGRPEGLFIDILEQVAKQEKWKLVYVVGTWSDLLYRISSGKIDVLPGIAINDIRAQRFLFSDQTILSNWGQIYVPDNSTIQAILDLDKKNIAVLRGDLFTSSEDGLLALCLAFKIDCHLTEYPTYEMVLRAVSKGYADAGLVSRLYGATSGHFFDTAASPIILMPMDIRFALSRKFPQADFVKERLDYRLGIFKKDELSIYHQRLHSLFEHRKSHRDIPSWLYKLLFGIGLLLIILLFTAQFLRWRIKVTTRELAATEAQYQGYFNGVAIALCEGDSSRALLKLDELLDSGVEDLRTHLDSHPGIVKDLFTQVRVINANPATMKMFGVKTLNELQQWLPKSLTPGAYDAFKEFLIAASENKSLFFCEIPLLTADEHMIRVLLNFPISNNAVDLQHIPITMLDVSHLRETEKQLSLVVKGASLGFWDWNLLTDELQVNERWMEILGLQTSDLFNHVNDWLNRLHPEDKKRILPTINDHIEEGKTYNVEYRMQHISGHWIWIEGSGGAVEYDPHTHKPTRACGTHQEITERKRTSETLHTLMQSMVGITGEDFFEHVARELCHWFEADGANIGELTKNTHIKSLATILDGKVIKDYHYPLKGTPYEKTIKQGPCLYPQGVQNMFPGHEDLIVLDAQGFAGSPIHDIHGNTIGIVWVVSRKPLFMSPEWEDVMDIIAARISAEIERMRAMDKLEYQATYDVLTELPNRRLLLDRLNQVQSTCRRHDRHGAVLFMDLDHFKTINDSLGHTAGDRLLQQVAERLKSQIRDEDTASRLGGDEFIVLFSELNSNPNIAAQQARQGARKIQKALSQPYTIEGNELHITPSMGVVIFPMNHENAEDILKYADTAMYRAKEGGRNTIRFFLPGMQEAIEQQLQLQTDLRHAFHNNELLLFYQPQVDCSGNLVCAEALLRWFHPHQGIVDPQTLITGAEESGLILPISEWIMIEALTQSKTWIENTEELNRIAINISTVHFHQVGFTDQIEQILQETGVDPQRLILEIHESALVENFEETYEKVLKLKKLGVRFSIDCFGIGYASIAYLRRLPVDQIKIDRSFIRDIASDPKDAQLVQALISMAKMMEIEVVAIGVEQESQLEFLREKGCQIFQGYYFCRPVSASQFQTYLQKETA